MRGGRALLRKGGEHRWPMKDAENNQRARALFIVGCKLDIGIAWRCLRAWLWVSLPGWRNGQVKAQLGVCI